MRKISRKEDLFRIHKEKDVKAYWMKHGHRATSVKFNTTIILIRRIAEWNGWKRPASFCPNIVESVLRGTSNPWSYPTLDFGLQPGQTTPREIRKAIYLMRKRGTFIGWVMENSERMYCREIINWIDNEKSKDWVTTPTELKQVLREDNTGRYVDRHFRKIDLAYELYKKQTSTT